MQTEEKTISLVEFMDRFGPTLMRKARETLPPVVEEPAIASRGRKPLGVQALASTAMVESLKRHRVGFLAAEMSTGKTKMALDALMNLNPRGRYLVMCPPHLVEKWKREAEMEGFHAVILTSPADIRRLPALPTPLVAVLSREKAKLGPGWKPAYQVSRVRHQGDTYEVLTCPRCAARIRTEAGTLATPEELAKRRTRCASCGEPLWQVAPPRRIALADALKRLLPRGFFQVLVLDEAHEYKAQESAQGIVAGILADWVGRALVLTGTLFGGYASNLFALFYRFLPGFRLRYRLNQQSLKKFVSRYGLLETIETLEGEEGRYTRRRAQSVRTRERPGLSPLLLPHLLPYTAFVRLPEVAEALPPYREEVVYLDLEEPHRSLVEDFYSSLRSAVRQALIRGSKKLLGGYLQGALQGPDAPFEDVEVRDPDTGQVIARLPALGEKYTSPKERWLLDLVRREKAEGRRVLVYVQNTEVRDQVARLTRLLQAHGYRAVGLYAHTTKPEKREAWLREKVKEGLDVLVAHPRLVQTGLDLIDFPTLVFYQTEYSVYTLRQAARRSLRIGQTQPVRVYFLAYRGTLQVEALRLIATKARSSLALEGELVEGGLAVASEEDPTLALAKALADRVSPPEVEWVNVAGVETAREEPEKKAPEPVRLPVLKQARVVRVGRHRMVLPAGQPVLFEEVT